MFDQVDANPYSEAYFWSCSVFPCFVGISAVVGLGTTNAPFVLFDLPTWPFLLCKKNTFRGKMTNFDTKSTIKLRKNAKSINGFMFTHVQVPLQENPPTKKRFDLPGHSTFCPISGYVSEQLQKGPQSQG